MAAVHLAAVEAAVAVLPLLPVSAAALDCLDRLEAACAVARVRFATESGGKPPARKRRLSCRSSDRKPDGEGDDEGGGGLVPLCSTEWKGKRWCDANAAEALRLTCLYRGPHTAPSARFESPAAAIQLEPGAAGSGSTRIEVTGEDSLLAAWRLVSDSSAAGGGRPVVLNMAHASWRGGGFLHGTAGQEEEICRRSSVFCELMEAEYPLPAEGVLVTPEVTVLRGEGPAYAELDEPFSIAVVTAAAPMCPDVSTEEGARAYEELMARKVEGLLKACAASGYRRLVLSAWGCGAFRNPPEVVARLFREALSRPPLDKAFQHVVFAILDRWGSEQNKLVFEREFQAGQLTS
ncbi:unnamed protein product [Polarella glacialis]|uniref:Microbial-type PARG catalytic domain-containing protein n=1 Tax=Polarella glacialis TaxID=89957 RepID=A0A813IYD0_POLGL|nr:unnamed protein product [Polarella glacialis]